MAVGAAVGVVCFLSMYLMYHKKSQASSGQGKLFVIRLVHEQDDGPATETAKRKTKQGAPPAIHGLRKAPARPGGREGGREEHCGMGATRARAGGEAATDEGVGAQRSGSDRRQAPGRYQATRQERPPLPPALPGVRARIRHSAPPEVAAQLRHAVGCSYRNPHVSCALVLSAAD